MTNHDSLTIRSATSEDAAVVADIYNHYIINSVVTFEMEAIEPQEVYRRMQMVESLSLPWVIAEWDDEVVGYAFASRWHQRAAYQNSAEATVYVEPNHCRRGIGVRLLEQLLELVSERKIHTLISGISLPNEASVSLHEKFGFQKVAHYKEVGFKFGNWIDVGYWQKMM
ncbi:MAG: GNAT family N-acetyltransferase [Rubripirellula sp.]|nr:GNAT family N-acetyltransferase [Rubripirellula sp.]